MGIEVKQESGKPSLLQKMHLKNIGNAGGIGVLAYPSGFEQLKELIDNIISDKDYKIEFNDDGYLEFRSGNENII